MRSTLIIAVWICTFAVPVAAEAAAELRVYAKEHQQMVIPRGAQRIPFLSLTLRADCSADVDLQSMTFRHAGKGRSADLSSVYALDGGRRISRGYQISGQGNRVTLHLRSFSIPACQARTVVIAANLSPDAAAGGEHRLVLEDAGSVDADSAVVTLSIDNNVLSGVRAAGIKEGAIKVETLNLNQPVRYGRRKIVARVRLSADAANDHLIHAITLTNKGSASDSDLQYLYLETLRGERLSALVTSLQGNNVRLPLYPPLLLEKNTERLFVVRADVRASRRRTVRFTVEEESDVEAVTRLGRELRI